ncbi:MAG: hypothetical protein AAGI08_01480 [Bacteroidota bacterium]
MTSSPTLIAFQLDGSACGVDVRESWAFKGEEVTRLYEDARGNGFGAFVLPTCFRVELILTGDAPVDELAAWGRARLSAIRPGSDLSVFRLLVGEEAIRHVFRVAAGLESAVLGEAQVLGQVRRARARAEHMKVLTPMLNAVLTAAVQTGQQVRRRTAINRGAASTATAAVQWADDMFDGLEGLRIAVVGAGDIGRRLVTALDGIELESLTVVSAHAPPHAGFHVVPPSALTELLPNVDVLFAATTRSVLTAELARTVWADGALRAVADLGMPRNVEPGVGDVAGVECADIDVLGDVVDANLAVRRAAIPKVERAIDKSLKVLQDKLSTFEREQLVGDFRRNAETIRQETLAYVCGRCQEQTCGSTAPGVPGDGPCTDAETLTRTLTTRLLHDLTHTLRHGSAHLDDQTLRTLLSLPDARG